MSPHAEWIYINQHDDFPTEIGHVMAFIHRLRSLWLVPDDMRLAAFGAWPLLLSPINGCSHYYANKCPDRSSCPLSQIRPEQENIVSSDTLDGLWSKVGFPESLTRTVSSSIAHLFANIPGCKLERNPQVSKIRPLDFALIPCLFPGANIDHYTPPTLSPTLPFIMMGMKGPAYWKEKAGVWSTGHSLISLRMDLADHAHSQLSGLVARLEELASELGMIPLPEWLVLFGIIHDTEQMHIVAHIPIRKEHTGLRCVSYLFDDFPLGAPTSPEERSSCGITEATVALVLTVLRQHAGYMTRSLYGIGTFRASNTMSNVKPTSCSDCSQYMDHAELSTSTLAFNGTNDGNSEYSTCPSGTSLDVPKQGSSQMHSRDKCPFSHANGSSSEWKNGSDAPNTLSCSLSDISCCSSCSSLLDDGNASSSEYSERAWNGSGERRYMKPSTSSLYQGDPGGDKSQDHSHLLKRLDDKRRAAIIAWTKGVAPTQTPEEDTYRIAVLH